MSTVKFAPNMQVETSDGIGVVKYTKNKAPDYREVESVCVETDGKEAFFSPDSVKVLDVVAEESAPETQREPKRAKKVKLNIAFQRLDGSLLPKNEFLQLMSDEYEKLAESLGLVDCEDIAALVNAEFDKHIGVRYNLQYLHSAVVKSLKPEGVDAWKKLDKRFKTYMEINTGEGKIFQTKLGKGGGHYRAADHKEEAKA
jgi:hypothetical protein